VTGPHIPQLGSVIWAELEDANGFSKVRPAVVVTPTAEVAVAGSVRVVAITTRLPDPLPADHVLLPWHRDGKTRSGLAAQVCCGYQLAGASPCRWSARSGRNPAAQGDRRLAHEDRVRYSAAVTVQRGINFRVVQAARFRRIVASCFAAAHHPIPAQRQARCRQPLASRPACRSSPSP
jgi:hypothetical protein